MKFDEITAGNVPSKARGKTPQKKGGDSPNNSTSPTAALAAKGRNGDTEIAHMTPGEIVVPLPLQTPKVMNTLHQTFAGAGVPLERYTVSSSQSSVNPETGVEEYGFGSFLKKAAGVVLPIAGAAVGGPIGGAIGGAVGAKISGGNPLLGAVGGGLGGLTSGAFGAGFNAMGPLSAAQLANPLTAAGWSFGGTSLGSALGSLSPFLGSIQKGISGLDGLLSGTALSSPSGISNIISGQQQKSDLPDFFNSLKKSETLPRAAGGTSSKEDIALGIAGAESDDPTALAFDATSSFNSAVPGARRGYGGALSNDPTTLPWLNPPSGTNNLLNEWQVPQIGESDDKINPDTGVQQFAAPTLMSRLFRLEDSRAGQGWHNGSGWTGRNHPTDNFYGVSLSDGTFLGKDFLESRYQDFLGTGKSLADIDLSAGAALPDFLKPSYTTAEPVTTPTNTTPAAPIAPTPFVSPKSQQNPLATIVSAPTPPTTGGAPTDRRAAFLAARERSRGASTPPPMVQGAGMYRPRVLPYLQQQNPSTGAQEFFFKGEGMARGQKTPIYSTKLDGVVAGNRPKNMPPKITRRM